MVIKINLDRGAVQRVPLELVLPRVKALGVQVERGARNTVRVRTGAVRGSIGSSLKVTKTRAVVTITSRHARSMLEHEGARKHRIDAKPGGPLLRFYWAKMGRVVVFASVNHPGTSGSKYLTGPLQRYGRRAGFKVALIATTGSGTITP